MVRINGINLDAAGKNLAEYLADTSYNPQRIAVEKNGEIIPRDCYSQTVLKDGDTLEVVSFVGGG